MNLIGLGDSLMQYNGQATFPQMGWFQVLGEFLIDDKTNIVKDFALNGRSTKSFIAEGQFDKALEAANKGDAAFISFGHNDEKDDPLRHTDPFGSYQENLALMAEKFKLKGTHVIFLTSACRLIYDSKGILKKTHGDYPEAMKKEAEKLHIDFIDLSEITYLFYSKHNFEFNIKYFMTFKPGEYPNYPQGSHDTSHLKKEGAENICHLLVPEFKKISYLKALFK